MTKPNLKIRKKEPVRNHVNISSKDTAEEATHACTNTQSHQLEIEEELRTDRKEKHHDEATVVAMETEADHAIMTVESAADPPATSADGAANAADR